MNRQPTPGRGAVTAGLSSREKRSSTFLPRGRPGLARISIAPSLRSVYGAASPADCTASGRLKETIALSPETRKEARLPFTGVFHPDQLATLTTTLDRFCLVRGILRDSPERNDAARAILYLFSRGCCTLENLDAMLPELNRHVSRRTVVI